MEDDNNKKEKKTKEQEFIVETPIEIEERINGSDKIIKYSNLMIIWEGKYSKL